MTHKRPFYFLGYLLFIAGIILAAGVFNVQTSQSATGQVLGASTFPALPRVYLRTSISDTPSLGQTIVVPAGGSLQAYINQACLGDTLVLSAGATYAGNFTLPNKVCGTGWITIRTSNLTGLPSEGNRVGPQHASSMPKIVSTNLTPPIQVAQNAHHYRFTGVEITATHSNTANMLISLVHLETSEASLAQQANNLIFDRVYVHGTPTGDLKRCFTFNAASVALIDSYVSDCHAVGVDSQAISGWQGPGPFKIVNNYLEGAGENILFGGSDAPSQDYAPKDLEIRRNYFFKPLKWRIGDPSYAGIPWGVKNLFELKNATRALIDGNVFENNWPHAQNGFGILFTVRNQDGGNPLATVEDVTFTNNIIRRVANGVNTHGSDNIRSSQPTRRLMIANNLFTGVGDLSGNGRMFQWVAGGATGGAADVIYDHNTVVYGATSQYLLYCESGAVSRFTFTNNLSTAGMPGSCGSDYTASNNGIAASVSAIGFVNPAAGDYSLSASSPYTNAGSDGKDIGVDWARLTSATNGVINGAGGGNPPPPPPPSPVPPPPAGTTRNGYVDVFSASNISGWGYDSNQPTQFRITYENVANPTQVFVHIVNQTVTRTDATSYLQSQYGATLPVTQPLGFQSNPSFILPSPGTYRIKSVIMTTSGAAVEISLAAGGIISLGGAIPPPAPTPTPVPPPLSGVVADPTKLPKATGQSTPSTTPQVAANSFYLDPISGAKVWRATSPTYPCVNSTVTRHHDYGDTNQISLPWGDGFYTMLIHACGEYSGEYQLVDFKPGVGFGNWRFFQREAKPDRNLSFVFSYNPATPRIAYSVHDGILNRYNTATNQIENTGNFPRLFGDGSWLQTGLTDTWFIARQNAAGCAAWNSQTNQFITATVPGFDECHLENRERYVELNTGSGGDGVWDLQTNTVRPFNPPSGTIFHMASPSGYFTSVDVHTGSGRQPYYRMNPVTGTGTLIFNPPYGYDYSAFHHSGNWAYQDVPDERQWFLISTFNTMGPTGGEFLKQAIGFMRLDGSDVRFLAHTYNTGSEYWELPKAQLGPDGRLVMFSSRFPGTSAGDVYVVEVPTSASTTPPPSPVPPPPPPPVPPPAPTPTPVPPPPPGTFIVLQFITPTSGQVINGSAVTINVQALEYSGNTYILDHARVRMDNGVEIDVPRSNNGVYTFQSLTSGQHTVSGYLVTADGTKIPGSESSVMFTVSGGATPPGCTGNTIPTDRGCVPAPTPPAPPPAGGPSPVPNIPPSSHNFGPFGFLDVINDLCEATGWAADAGNDNEQVDVHFYLDKGPRSKNRNPFSVFANRNRSDVGGRGFGFKLPQEFCDGNTHILHAFAVSRKQANRWQRLFSSPFLFRFRQGGSTPIPLPQRDDGNYLPMGYLDNINEQSMATGWAMDANDISQAVNIHFYVDRSPAQGGTVAFHTSANQQRADVGPHGFSVAIPQQYRDGRAHRLYAFAVDSQDSQRWKQLEHSPLSFQISGTSPGPVPPPPNPTPPPSPTPTPVPPPPSPVPCAQVITYARNPQTGEVRAFSTPCEVPAGWQVVPEPTPPPAPAPPAPTPVPPPTPNPPPPAPAPSPVPPLSNVVDGYGDTLSSTKFDGWFFSQKGDTSATVTYVDTTTGTAFAQTATRTITRTDAANYLSAIYGSSLSVTQPLGFSVNPSSVLIAGTYRVQSIKLNVSNTLISLGAGATGTFTISGSTPPPPVPVPPPVPPPTSGVAADPTKLPKATGQSAPTTTPQVAANSFYLDPISGAKVWRATSPTYPCVNSTVTRHHDYGDTNQISLPWGDGFYTMLIHVCGEYGGAYQLVDFKPGVGFSNWRFFPRGATPGRDLNFVFSYNPSTPRIAYVMHEGVVHRYNTATNQLEDTGNFPKDFQGFGWLQIDLTDTWLVARRTASCVAWNTRTNQFIEATIPGFDECHLENRGRYVDLNTGDGGDSVWDLQTNTIRPFNPPSGHIFHTASPSGYFTSVDVNTGGGAVKYYRMDPVTGTGTFIYSPPYGYDYSGFHHSGNWAYQNVPDERQWFLMSTYSEGGTGGEFLKHAIGFIRLDGSDVRFLAHSYISTGPADYWRNVPRAQVGPDGRLVMFGSDFRGASSGDVYIVEVPTS